VGAMAAAGAGPPPVVAAPLADPGTGQVLDAGDALGGVGQIFSGAGHGAVLLRVAPYRRVRRLPRVRSIRSPVAVLQSLISGRFALPRARGETFSLPGLDRTPGEVGDRPPPAPTTRLAPRARRDEPGGATAPPALPLPGRAVSRANADAPGVNRRRRHAE